MMKDYSNVNYITNYRGELAEFYETHYDYVKDYGFEKDYFYEWTESVSDYPMLSEIIDFCANLDKDIRLWLEGVEAGVIDPEVVVEDVEE